MRLSRREPNTLASRVRQLRSVYWLTPAVVAACLLLALADSVIWGAERAAGRQVLRHLAVAQLHYKVLPSYCTGSGKRSVPTPVLCLHKESLQRIWVDPDFALAAL